MGDCDSPNATQVGPDEWECSKCGGCVACLIEQCEERKGRITALEARLASVEAERNRLDETATGYANKLAESRRLRLEVEARLEDTYAERGNQDKVFRDLQTRYGALAQRHDTLRKAVLASRPHPTNITADREWRRRFEKALAAEPKEEA